MTCGDVGCATPSIAQHVHSLPQSLAFTGMNTGLFVLVILLFFVVGSVLLAAARGPA